MVAETNKTNLTNLTKLLRSPQKEISDYYVYTRAWRYLEISGYGFDYGYGYGHVLCDF